MDVTDSNGVPYVKLLIEQAKAGSGFVAYSFPRSATDQGDQRKISTAMYYAPWDMVVGSGVYVGDIDEAFRSQLIRVSAILVLSISAIVAFCIFVVRTITRPLSLVTSLIERLSQGDRDIAVPY